MNVQNLYNYLVSPDRFATRRDSAKRSYWIRPICTCSSFRICSAERICNTSGLVRMLKWMMDIGDIWLEWCLTRSKSDLKIQAFEAPAIFNDPGSDRRQCITGTPVLHSKHAWKGESGSQALQTLNRLHIHSPNRKPHSTEVFHGLTGHNSLIAIHETFSPGPD